MEPTIIPRELVAERLAVTTTVLSRYEALGLVRAVQSGSIVGYGPAEVRRLWTILSFQRDLGINLAGVEVALRLRDQLAELHQRLDAVARQLHETLETGGPDDRDA